MIAKSENQLAIFFDVFLTLLICFILLSDQARTAGTIYEPLELRIEVRETPPGCSESDIIVALHDSRGNLLRSSDLIDKGAAMRVGQTIFFDSSKVGQDVISVSVFLSNFGENLVPGECLDAAWKVVIAARGAEHRAELSNANDWMVNHELN